jgi:PIN domain nuclease of toxin-antitoxin system
MKLLFDTHAFIWWDSEPAKLSPRVLSLCQDRTNELLLSVASAWEMQIKFQLGKLEFNTPLGDLIARQQEINGVRLLPVALEHVLALQNLPTHHRDPFDRVLVAQANTENAVLISNDPMIARYPVEWIF